MDKVRPSESTPGNCYVIAFLRPSGIRKFDPHIQEDSRSVKGKNFNSFDSYFSLKGISLSFEISKLDFLKKKMKGAGWSMTRLIVFGVLIIGLRTTKQTQPPMLRQQRNDLSVILPFV